MPSRGIAPVLRVALLALVVVALAGVTIALVPMSSDAEVTTLDVSLTADPDPYGGTLTLRHEGGDPVDLEAITVRVFVDGDPLSKQPKVPYFSHPGFISGGTGPFSISTDDVWSPGERGSITIASTNDPTIEPSARVTIRILHDDRLLVETSAVASG